MDKSNVLIFDNHSSASILEEILSAQFNTEHVLKTDDIVREVELFVPDVVFLNIDSPNAIKSLEKLSEMNALVIATTSLSDVKTEVLALKSGAKACLKKPLNHDLVALYTSDLAERSHERKMAQLDGLTQIFNRKSYDVSLKEVWQNAIDHNAQSANKESVSIIMMDIDHFKKYNDTYGHAQGDEAIKAVARAAKSAVRNGIDVVARYGGEEFAIVLPNTSAKCARVVAQRVKNAVFNLEMEHRHNTAANRVTVSVGVSTCEPTSEINMEHFLNHCDQKLYEAKEKGRNTVCSGKFWSGVRRIINDHRPSQNHTKPNNSRSIPLALKHV